MKKLSYFCFSLCFILILSACSINQTSKTYHDAEHAPRASITKVFLDLQKESGWWVIPEGAKSLTIHVEAKNTDTVLFWLVPTGTDVWSERTLIGYDKDASDGWSLKWDFGDRKLHNHIFVQALGIDDVSMDSKTINVTANVPD